MSNANDSITRKVEEAVTAYLDDFTFDSGIPASFNFLPGFNAEARLLPCCAVVAGKPVESIPGASVYRIPVTLNVMTKRGDTSESAHGLIAGLIERAFWDSDAVKTALNKPEPPAEDNRTVNSFYLYELFCNGPGPQIQTSENIMISSIEMEWICQGWNHIADA